MLLMTDILCRAIEIAGLRVEQAKALGVPPKLEYLLIDESWRKALGGEFSKPYMRKLNEYLSTEWQQHSIYPPQQLIFRYPASMLCQGIVLTGMIILHLCCKSRRLS